MKHLSLPLSTLLFVFLVIGISTQAQQFKWATGGGTPEGFGSDPSWEWEQADFMCTDANGNIYVVSDVGTDALTADTFYSSGAYGADQNIFITSYNCQGQMRWAKRIASSSACQSFGIATDNLGNIDLAGRFLTLGSTLHIGYDTALSGAGMFYLGMGVIQLDTSGNFHWIRYTGQNTEAAFEAQPFLSIATDNANNVHLLETMNSGVQITPTITSTGGTYDIVYSPSGTLLSAVKLQLDSEWYFNGAVIDPVTNKLYVSGQIDQYAFGPTELTDTFYAAAFDASRNLLWQYFCGHGDDDAIVGIAQDAAKNLYFCGAASPYSGLTTFSFHGDSVSAPYDVLSIIMKTDTNGNVDWFTHYDSHTSINSFSSITLLPNNKIACAGTFAGTLFVDGTPTFSAAVADPYLAVVDSAGDLLTIQQIYGDDYYNGGNAITSDKAGNIYLGGYVGDSIWAGTPSVGYETVGGNTDFFVMKYGVDCSCTSGPIAAYTDVGTHYLAVTYTGTTAGLDSVVWRFGDGGTATGITAAHTYTVAGTYRVCATVYTTCGSDIYCTSDTVVCVGPPVASFTKSGSTTLAVTYTGTTPALDSVGWIFGDGYRTDGTTATHTYAATGIYQVCAIAYSPCGSDTSCQYDTVNCIVAPTASFTFTGTATINTTYTGTTGIDSIGWIFGDGARADGTTATHTYTSPGTYNVCVVAHSSCGNDTSCQTVTVVCVTAPTASFTDTGSITIGATYTGTTTGVDSTVWNFGDGSATVDGATATHTYTAAGIYDVCVTAYSPCGSNTSCSDDTVLCVAPPIASFTDTGSHTVGFTYTGTTADVDSISWSFGDSNTSTTTAPVHTYTASGTYDVCVTVYTGCGMDSFCTNITVLVPSSVPIVNTGNSIRVFPNPANDDLTVTGIVEIMSYRLLSMTGACTQQGYLQIGSNEISMQGIIPGIYVLELTGRDGNRDIVRVVKQ